MADELGYTRKPRRHGGPTPVAAPKPEDTTNQHPLIAGGLRVGGSFISGILNKEPGLGSVAAAGVGGLTELLAEMAEEGSVTKPFEDPTTLAKRVGTEAALSAIPGSKYFGNTAIKSATRSGLIGGAGEAARELAKTGDIDPKSIARSTVLSGVTGGVLGALMPNQVASKVPTAAPVVKTMKDLATENAQDAGAFGKAAHAAILGKGWTIEKVAKEASDLEQAGMAEHANALRDAAMRTKQWAGKTLEAQIARLEAMGQGEAAQQMRRAAAREDVGTTGMYERTRALDAKANAAKQAREEAARRAQEARENFERLKEGGGVKESAQQSIGAIDPETGERVTHTVRVTPKSEKEEGDELLEMFLGKAPKPPKGGGNGGNGGGRGRRAPQTPPAPAAPVAAAPANGPNAVLQAQIQKVLDELMPGTRAAATEAPAAEAGLASAALPVAVETPKLAPPVVTPPAPAAPIRVAPQPIEGPIVPEEVWSLVGQGTPNNGHSWLEGHFPPVEQPLIGPKNVPLSVDEAKQFLQDVLASPLKDGAREQAIREAQLLLDQAKDVAGRGFTGPHLLENIPNPGAAGQPSRRVAEGGMTIPESSKIPLPEQAARLDEFDALMTHIHGEDAPIPGNGLYGVEPPPAPLTHPMGTEADTSWMPSGITNAADEVEDLESGFAAAQRPLAPGELLPIHPEMAVQSLEDARAAGHVPAAPIVEAPVTPRVAPEAPIAQPPAAAPIAEAPSIPAVTPKRGSPGEVKIDPVLSVEEKIAAATAVVDKNFPKYLADKIKPLVARYQQLAAELEDPMLSGAKRKAIQAQKNNVGMEMKIMTNEAEAAGSIPTGHGTAVGKMIRDAIEDANAAKFADSMEIEGSKVVGSVNVAGPETTPIFAMEPPMEGPLPVAGSKVTPELEGMNLAPDLEKAVESRVSRAASEVPEAEGPKATYLPQRNPQDIINEKAQQLVSEISNGNLLAIAKSEPAVARAAIERVNAAPGKFPEDIMKLLETRGAGAEGGTVLGSGFGGLQAIAGLAAKQPEFAKRIAGGVIGGAIGAATDPFDDPITSIAAGAGLGLTAPDVMGKIKQMGVKPSQVPQLQKALNSADPAEAESIGQAVYHLLPAYQRFSYLSSVPGMGANIIAGPWGSMFFGALARGMAGDKRGWEVVRRAVGSEWAREFFNEVPNARQMILRAGPQELERSEMTGLSNIRGGHWLQGPAIGMAAGDAASRKMLMSAGFTEQEAREMTLTSELYLPFLKKILGLARGENSTMMQMMIPFAKTPLNIAEQAATRFPGLGFIAQNIREKHGAPVLSKSVQVAQQSLGLIIGMAGYAVGSTVDPNDKTTASVVSRFLTNTAGPYSGLAALGFAAAQANAKGQSGPEAIVPEFMKNIPLPTFQPITETYNTVKKAINEGPGTMGIEDLPRGIIPAVLREPFPYGAASPPLPPEVQGLIPDENALIKSLTPKIPTEADFTRKPRRRR